jgi:xylulose-5-phosphate/fructose-6-phosphate phosphoketolase
MDATLTIADSRLAALDRYWRATNYLSAAQLYLRDNPLLRRPLAREDCKRRVLGHWGTVPGLNLLYTHLNRLIADRELSATLIVGPGHGAPAIHANTYLEGTLGATDPRYVHGEAGLQALLRDFSWPGGLPSHCTARTPGALHEGGELGYALSHAYGVALDDPDAFVVCVIGDGEAETGPLAASWLSHAFCDPATSGSVLPILHLNGYKLSAPSVFARMEPSMLQDYLRGHGYDPIVVEAEENDLRDDVHLRLWRAFDEAADRLAARRQLARQTGALLTPPVLVLVSPKGMTGPRTLDGLPVEATPRAHGIPIDDPYGNPAHRDAVEHWLRSYRPDELFDADGKPHEELLAVLPRPALRLGTSPRANGGNLRVPLTLPAVDDYAPAVTHPGATACSATHALGAWLAAVLEANADRRNLRIFSPDEAASNKLDAIFEVTARAWTLPLAFSDSHLARDGRLMEMLSEHTCEGWMEGYVLSGRHGLFASYEGFVPIVDSMVAQYAKWLKTAAGISWRTPLSALNFLMTSHVWRQEHNGYSHQGPGFVNAVMNEKAEFVRVYLPPDASSLLCVAEHALASTDRINVVVAPKQDAPQWLDLATARAQLAAGATRWSWAADDANPDVVLGCAGDVMTLETLAAVTLLRTYAPGLRLRVANVVDLFALTSPELHPHGIDDDAFVALFDAETPVVFAYHGYPRTVHELIYRRAHPERFHVHGYIEEGTTTTPFDMTVLNGASRYHLAHDALHRAGERGFAVPSTAVTACIDALRRHAEFIRAEGYDLPEVTAWTWPA